MRRAILFAIGIGALLATAGCMSIAVDVTVDSDGTVETYEMNMTMNNTMYSFMDTEARSQGYDNVGRYVLEENMSVNPDNAGSIDVEETTNQGNTTVNILMENYDPGPDSNITVRKDNGSMIYEDVSFGTEGADQTSTTTPTDNPMGTNATAASLTYRVDMPGNITETSPGATVDGDVATWDVDGGSEVYIRAESDVDGSGGSDSTLGLGPGFGAGAAIVAVALSIAALRRQTTA